MGLRQIFIRFAGCNLSCRYCDTTGPADSGACSVEVKPGRGEFLQVESPLSGPELMRLLGSCFETDLHHSVSLTGGEPLLHDAYLAGLLPEIKKMGLLVYLETNGTLAENLSRVISLVDIVSMDIKLPGTAGCGELWASHLRFLRVARRTQVFVKIIMDDESLLEEFERAVDLIGGVDPGIALVIQPVTAEDRCALSPGRALEFQTLALKKLQEVRIIPQAHIMMRQL